MSDERSKLHAEAVAILDGLRDGFLYRMDSDSHIEAIETADARLREIIAQLAGVS